MKIRMTRHAGRRHSLLLRTSLVQRCLFRAISRARGVRGWIAGTAGTRLVHADVFFAKGEPHHVQRRVDDLCLGQSAAVCALASVRFEL